jgi:hypothetical protein
MSYIPCEVCENTPCTCKGMGNGPAAGPIADAPNYPSPVETLRAQLANVLTPPVRIEYDKSGEPMHILWRGHHEIDAVLIEVEHGQGALDDIQKNTLRRVASALSDAERILDAVHVAEGSREAALHPTPKPDDREGR